MGERAAETVREIEHVRDELDGKMRELEHRVPSPAVWVKRLAGFAIGGGVGSTVLWFAFRRVRNRRRGAEPVRAEGVNVVEFALPRIDDSTRQWLIGAGAAYLVVRLAELRQSRRTNRLLAQRAA